MGQAIDLSRFIVELLALAVAVGYWGGKLVAMRRRPLTSIVDAPNGHPSLGELTRRVEALEEDRRTYVRKPEADAHMEATRREREDLWGAIKDIRTLQHAAQRRIDSLTGLGS